MARREGKWDEKRELIGAINSGGCDTLDGTGLLELAIYFLNRVHTVPTKIYKRSNEDVDLSVLELVEIMHVAELINRRISLITGEHKKSLKDVNTDIEESRLELADKYLESGLYDKKSGAIVAATQFSDRMKASIEKTLSREFQGEFRA